MPAKALRLPVSVLQKDSASQYCLFCLPSGGRDLLLAMAHRMNWSIYVNDDNTPATLTDNEQAIVDATIEGLIMGCEFPDLSEPLQAIADALASLRLSVTCAPDVNVTCGDGGSFIVYPGPGLPPVVNPGPLPDGPILPEVPLPPVMPPDGFIPGDGEPPVGETWEQFDLDACEAANAMVDWLHKVFLVIADFLGQDIQTYTALVIAIVNIAVYGLAILFERSLILRIVDKVGDMELLQIPAAAAEAIADWIDNNRQALVCILYENRGDYSAAFNGIVAEVLNFAAGVAEWQAHLSLLQEAIEYILPLHLLPGAIVAGVTYDNENKVSCAGCEQTRFMAVTVPDSLFNLASVTKTRVDVSFSSGLLTVTKNDGNQAYPGQAVMSTATDFAALLAHYGGGAIVAGAVEIVERTTAYTNDGWTNVPCVNCGTIDLDAVTLGFTAIKIHPQHNTPELADFITAEFGAAGTVLAGVPSWNWGTLTINEPVGVYVKVKLWLVIDTEYGQ